MIKAATAAALVLAAEAATALKADNPSKYLDKEKESQLSAHLLPYKDGFYCI